MLSWGDDFHIRDEDGRECFFVDGHVFSIGNKLSLQDLEGNQLAFITQKLLTWGPTYAIDQSGQEYAVVKKKLFTLFGSKFTISVDGPDRLQVDGDFFDHEYTFTRNGKMVAQVSKRWFSWTDTYGVEILSGEDDVLVLSCVIVIAQICRDARRSG